MCGIAGVAGLHDPGLVAEMTRTLVHRGPDGEGVRGFESVDGRMPATLGHRRLAIIDPTPRGAQPMGSPDGRHWITYNGEIYNFRALRGELEQLGHRFETDCDTEVLLAMYAEYGEAMLPRLNGIYAFAIWDTKAASLFLARDRLGVKPLYYAEHDGALYFASEVKALLPAIPTPAMNRQAIADYLTFLWVPDPMTLFDGVLKLPPGHCATFDAKGLRLREWWDMDFAPDGRSVDEWAGVLGEEVGEAVRRQMVSDVPLGSFLSGGIDSSAIVAEMRQAEAKVTTYTVGFSQEDLEHEIVPDDVKYARRLATDMDLDYHEQELHPRVVELLPKLVWHMDEPVADPACITTYLICSAARERLTVILSGMGGDEIFAGYPRYVAARIGRYADILPQAVRRGIRTASEGRLTVGPPGRMRGPRRNLMKLLRGIDQPTADRHLVYRAYYRPEELERVWSPEMRADVAGHDPFRQHREYFDRVRDEHWLNQLLYVDLKTFLPCLNLTYTDKMSMAASTEVRVPLLDDDLVALSGRIPPELKLRRLNRKFVFKRSQVGKLPDEIIWRPKAGFGAPIRGWLTNDLKPMIDDVLAPDAVRARGLFDPDEVRRLISANTEGSEDNALRLWALLTLELWQQTFADTDGRGVACAV